MSDHATEWSFTWHISDTDDVPKIDEEKVKYCVFQKELTTTGRLHWQGALVLRRNARRGGAQKAIGAPKWVHMDPKYKRSTVDQLVDYCKKDRSRADGPPEEVGPFEFGDLKFEPGRRSDLEAACECKSVEEVKTKFPTAYLKYNRGFEKLLEGKHDRRFKPTVFVMWGEGISTGKSEAWKKFMEKYPQFGIEYIKDNSEWWDGYHQQDVMIIEDFNPKEQKWCTASTFKQLFDAGTGYVYKKGQTRQQMLSKMVIITSNYDPKEWFPTERWERIDKRISGSIFCGHKDDVFEDWLPDIETIFSQYLEEPNFVSEPQPEQITASLRGGSDDLG